MAEFSCLSLNAQKTLRKPEKKPHKTQTVTTPSKPVRLREHTERRQTEITSNNQQNSQTENSEFQTMSTDTINNYNAEYEEQQNSQIESYTSQHAWTGTINGHEYVDIGLSIKWATCNVGASQPSDYGSYYFAWGETSLKPQYKKSNSATYKKTIDDISENLLYDAAHVNWGSTWRLPTKAEIIELIEKCTRKWTTINGYNGYLVTGPNGKSIFLPAAGWREGTSLHDVGERGFYWSSTPNEQVESAYSLYFNDDSFCGYWAIRYYGHTIRPVSD